MVKSYYTNKDKKVTAKNVIRSIPPAYIFVEYEDGSMHLQDGQSTIMKKEEMLDLIYGMMKFIGNDITDNDIEKHNEEVFEDMMIQMAGINWREEQSKLARSTEKKLGEKSKGWVYFLKADNGLTKIGRTKDLKKRIYHFTVKLPYELELIYSIETEYTVELEAQLHEKYKHLNVRGEWFDLDDKIMNEIRKGS